MYRKFVKKMLISLIFHHIHTSFSCTNHNLFSLFINEFLRLYLYAWIRNVNSILRGLSTKDINDVIKEKAFTRYKKYKAKKETIRKIKQLK